MEGTCRAWFICWISICWSFERQLLLHDRINAELWSLFVAACFMIRSEIHRNLLRVRLDSFSLDQQLKYRELYFLRNYSWFLHFSELRQTISTLGLFIAVLLSRKLTSMKVAQCQSFSSSCLFSILFTVRYPGRSYIEGNYVCTTRIWEPSECPAGTKYHGLHS